MLVVKEDQSGKAEWGKDQVFKRSRICFFINRTNAHMTISERQYANEHSSYLSRLRLLTAAVIDILVEREALKSDQEHMEYR